MGASKQNAANPLPNLAVTSESSDWKLAGPANVLLDTTLLGQPNSKERLDRLGKIDTLTSMTIKNVGDRTITKLTIVEDGVLMATFRRPGGEPNDGAMFSVLDKRVDRFDIPGGLPRASTITVDFIYDRTYGDDTVDVTLDYGADGEQTEQYPRQTTYLWPRVFRAVTSPLFALAFALGWIMGWMALAAFILKSFRDVRDDVH